MDVLKILVQGGLVMIPLLVCSIISFMILFERIRVYRKAMTPVERLRENMVILAKQKDWQGLESLCVNTPGIAANLIAEAVRQPKSLTKQEKFLELMGTAAATSLRKYLNYLSVIVTLAPLLGLLGTVTGMISSFSIMAVAEGQPLAITGGVGEALIATATGLCVAIITLIIHAYLKQKQDLIIGEMEEVSSLYLLALEEEESNEA